MFSPVSLPFWRIFCSSITGFKKTSSGMHPLLEIFFHFLSREPFTLYDSENKTILWCLWPTLLATSQQHMGKPPIWNVAVSDVGFAIAIDHLRLYLQWMKAYAKLKFSSDLCHHSVLVNNTWNFLTSHLKAMTLSCWLLISINKP